MIHFAPTNISFSMRMQEIPREHRKYLYSLSVGPSPLKPAFGLLHIRPTLLALAGMQFL
jgi:hypothetical protein